MVGILDLLTNDDAFNVLNDGKFAAAALDPEARDLLLNHGLLAFMADSKGVVLKDNNAIAALKNSDISAALKDAKSSVDANAEVIKLFIDNVGKNAAVVGSIRNILTKGIPSSSS